MGVAAKEFTIKNRTWKLNTFRAVSSGVAVFAVMFIAAFFASTNFMPVGDGSAAELSIVSTATGYYANISSLGTIDISIDATPDGALGIGKDTLTIDTNATSGYKLYIGMSGDTNRLYRDGDSATGDYLSPSSGTTASPIALSGNTWGYVAGRTSSSQTVNDYSEATKTDAIFAGVPVYGDEDVLYTSTSPGTSSTNTLDVYYGVNASTALPSGTYEGTVAYTAIVDAVINDGTEASIAPSSQEGLEAGQTLTISTGLYPGFTADNMGEIAVTIGSNACTNPTPSIDSTNHNLIITCTVPVQTSYGTYTVQVEIPKYSKVYTLTNAYEYIKTNDGHMHEFNCNSLTNTNDTALLEDIRDGTEYTVAKLTDGNCWMVEDLKLGGDSDLTLTSTYSDVAENFTLLAEDTGTWCQSDDSACDDQSKMLKTGVPNGYLYNWYAATAGSGTYSVSSGSVSSSICPKGWTLPAGSTVNGSFYYLMNTGGYNTIAKLMVSPVPGFGYTGRRIGDTTLDLTTRGFYWSRTVNGDKYAYDLNFASDTGWLDSRDFGNKYRGHAVRCIAKTPSTIVNMQDMSATICDNLAVGNILTLTDTRDQSTYAVKKLPDNKCWMVQNLKLVGSKTLTPSDSDVSDSSFILTASNTGTWCTTDSAACDDQSMVINTGDTYGVLYNWYAATAGTGTYSMGAGEEANSSICPRNWRLPKGGSDTSTNDFSILDIAYGGTGANRTGANTYSTFTGAYTSGNNAGFSRSGYRNGGSINDQGSRGYYWSSTANSSSHAYDLRLYSSDTSVNPQNYNVKWYGFSVRCIAD